LPTTNACIGDSQFGKDVVFTIPNDANSFYAVNLNAPCPSLCSNGSGGSIMDSNYKMGACTCPLSIGLEGVKNAAKKNTSKK
jgi:hypothetical protein